MFFFFFFKSAQAASGSVYAAIQSRMGLFQWKLKSMKDRVPVGCAVAKLGWCVRAKDAPFPSLSTQ